MVELIVVAVAGLALFLGIRHFKTIAIAKERAAETLKRVMPTWAAQGPFNSGEESAEAMRHAYIAVFDEEKAKSLDDVIRQHAVSYDAQPDEWEDTRRTALAAATPETAQYMEQIEIHKFHDKVAVLIMLMTDDMKIAEKISLAVGKLYESWGDEEKREAILAMICTEECRPILEKLADYPTNTPEWSALLAEAESFISEAEKTELN